MKLNAVEWNKIVGNEIKCYIMKTNVKKSNKFRQNN